MGVFPKGGGGLASKCATSSKPYLIPGVIPATGLFIDKVKPSAAIECGDPMPLVGTKLTDDDFACVQSWANAIVMAGGSGPGGTSGGGGAAGGTGGGAAGTGGGSGGTSGTAGAGGRGGSSGRDGRARRIERRDFGNGRGGRARRIERRDGRARWNERRDGRAWWNERRNGRARWNERRDGRARRGRWPMIALRRFMIGRIVVLAAAVLLCLPMVARAEQPVKGATLGRRQLGLATFGGTTPTPTG